MLSFRLQEAPAAQGTGAPHRSAAIMPPACLQASLISPAQSKLLYRVWARLQNLQLLVCSSSPSKPCESLSAALGFCASWSRCSSLWALPGAADRCRWAGCRHRPCCLPCSRRGAVGAVEDAVPRQTKNAASCCYRHSPPPPPPLPLAAVALHWSAASGSGWLLLAMDACT